MPDFGFDEKTDEDGCGEVVIEVSQVSWGPHFRRCRDKVANKNQSNDFGKRRRKFNFLQIQFSKKS
jgi:hypothetical protein